MVMSTLVTQADWLSLHLLTGSSHTLLFTLTPSHTQSHTHLLFYRCYMTLTAARHFHRGGNPKGPAGTGKTETVKDLGKALGMYVIIMNCSGGFDYKSMGRMFSGLAQVCVCVCACVNHFHHSLSVWSLCFESSIVSLSRCCL